MKKKTNGKNGRWAVVGSGPYGLWYGRVRALDKEVLASGGVRLYDARSIRYWYGRSGGITSLAAFGPCGPRMHETRMGAPIASTLVLDVKAIHDCSPEAVAAFSTVKTHEK